MQRKAFQVQVSEASPRSVYDMKRSLNDYFGESSSTKKQKELPTKKEKSSSCRTLLSATANGWKSTTLAKYHADEWLVINVDKSKKLVTSMQCSTCTQFEKEVISSSRFSPQWSSREGSTRLQHATALQYAGTAAHERLYDLYLKRKGVDLVERSQQNKDVLYENRQQNIVSGIAAMSHTHRMKK